MYMLGSSPLTRQIYLAEEQSADATSRRRHKFPSVSASHNVLLYQPRKVLTSETLRLRPQPPLAPNGVATGQNFPGLVLKAASALATIREHSQPANKHA
jgi:hypothetical protein